MEEGWLLARIVKKCIDEHDVVEAATGDQLQSMFRPLEVGLPGRIKNELLVLFCSIVHRCCAPLSLNVLEPLVEMLHSLFDSLKRAELVKDKYFFTCSVVSFLRKLKEKGEV